MVNVGSLLNLLIFAGLSGPALAAVARVVQRKRVPARRVLFHEGDQVTTFYGIERGRVRMSVALEDGEECTIDILGDGEFFPHAGFLANGVYPATACAMVDTDVVSSATTW